MRGLGRLIPLTRWELAVGLQNLEWSLRERQLSPPVFRAAVNGTWGSICSTVVLSRAVLRETLVDHLYPQ